MHESYTNLKEVDHQYGSVCILCEPIYFAYFIFVELDSTLLFLAISGLSDS